MLKLITNIQARRAARDDEEGAALVEYGLLVGLIAVVVAVTLGPLGTAIAALFTDITNQL